MLTLSVIQYVEEYPLFSEESFAFTANVFSQPRYGVSNQTICDIHIVKVK